MQVLLAEGIFFFLNRSFWGTFYGVGTRPCDHQRETKFDQIQVNVPMYQNAILKMERLQLEKVKQKKMLHPSASVVQVSKMLMMTIQTTAKRQIFASCFYQGWASINTRYRYRTDTGFIFRYWILIYSADPSHRYLGQRISDIS